MEKDQKVLVGLILGILVIALGIVLYLVIIKKDDSTDALKFKREYESLNNKTNEITKEKYLNVNINKNNVFVYKTDKDILDVMENEEAIIYFGYKESNSSRGLVSVLNNAAKENGINKVYYVDITNIRDEYEVIDGTISKIKNGTDCYYTLLNKMDSFLHEYYITDSNDDSYNSGEKRLFAPTVIAVKDGNVVGFYEGIISETDSYKTSSVQKDNLRIILNEQIQKIN